MVMGYSAVNNVINLKGEWKNAKQQINQNITYNFIHMDTNNGVLVVDDIFEKPSSVYLCFSYCDITIFPMLYETK